VLYDVDPDQVACRLWPAVAGDQPARPLAAVPQLLRHVTADPGVPAHLGVTDPLSALPSQGAAPEGTPKCGGPQRSLRHRGMAQPYGPPGRRSRGLPVRCRTGGEHGASWVIRHVPVNRACIPKSPSRDGPGCTSCADEQVELHRSGQDPEDVAAPLREPGPDRSVTQRSCGPTLRPDGWLDGEAPGSHRPTEVARLPCRSEACSPVSHGAGALQSRAAPLIRRAASSRRARSVLGP
jgi:hypothetical protein